MEIHCWVGNRKIAYNRLTDCCQTANSSQNLRSERKKLKKRGTVTCSRQTCYGHRRRSPRARPRFPAFARRGALGRTARRAFVSRPGTRVASSAVAMAAASPPIYHLLTLDYVEDILEKRDPYRADHIAGAKAAEADGKVVLAGALQNPTDAGVFVFKDCDEAFVDAFVKADAYYKAGLVTGYTIRPWMIVVGA